MHGVILVLFSVAVINQGISSIGGEKTQRGECTKHIIEILCNTVSPCNDHEYQAGESECVDQCPNGTVAYNITCACPAMALTTATPYFMTTDLVTDEDVSDGAVRREDGEEGTSTANYIQRSRSICINETDGSTGPGRTDNTVLIAVLCGAAGGAVLLAFVIALVVIVCKKRRRARSENRSQAVQPPSIAELALSQSQVTQANEQSKAPPVYENTAMPDTKLPRKIAEQHDKVTRYTTDPTASIERQLELGLVKNGSTQDARSAPPRIPKHTGPRPIRETTSNKPHAPLTSQPEAEDDVYDNEELLGSNTALQVNDEEREPPLEDLYANATELKKSEHNLADKTTKPAAVGRDAQPHNDTRLVNAGGDSKQQNDLKVTPDEELYPDDQDVYENNEQISQVFFNPLFHSKDEEDPYMNLSQLKRE